MKVKLTYLLIAVTAIAFGVVSWWYSQQQPKPQYRQVQFNTLPGWDKGQFKKSFQTFQTSCRVFLKQDSGRVVGTPQIYLEAGDWHPACRAAVKIKSINEQAAKVFFEKWFSPVEFYNDQPVKGLFTGYYMPLFKGSLTKTSEYSVPLYELPKDLVTVDLGLFLPQLKKKTIVGRVAGTKIVPYYTREEINKGAIKDKAKVIAWIHSPVDRVFLEIQGSGVIELPDGTQMYVGYDGQNGATYTSIASVLINKGVMTKDNASMQRIKKYLEAHPKQMDAVINKNKSFLFFKKLSLDGALGSQGVALTPGYSMAIDRKWIPMGTPLWLSTTRPDSHDPNVNKPMQRLMIAQDTGGAIRGKVRGDVFWGGGDKATLIAGHMKNEGHYWLLLPLQALDRIQKLKK
ncbi:murein transglycosylase A [Legionella waltersii]|uniref:Membrane-bound lytic murein transglycosylase A n=1 Tax=Legionella waltersii TaxID=66969 RepID=A0A0W1ANV7_9GAMM|nr:murein transglycosylase A [Legionella waltersii]KTD83025.1 Membrane-bound lytic murein transglycosylase [Legionella waltersii]SNV07712.1 Membrane-bound lytic murein transglycosylase [Legionella waltersii]